MAAIKRPATPAPSRVAQTSSSCCILTTSTPLASRILGKGALVGGMPVYKYISNRGLTFVENILLGQKISEYHTGYRAWSRQVLERLPLMTCSDDFVFDNQMIAQATYFGFRVGEISCPTKYFEEASSINFSRSVTYGLGVLKTAAEFRLKKWGITNPVIFDDLPSGRLAFNQAMGMNR